MTNHLELYKIFYFVAKNGSLTKAAYELSITQPAVSQAIKQLESLLGVKLFLRSPKGISLTSEGKLLLPYIERAYSEIINGEKKIKELLSIDYGELRIGASDMTLKYYLLPYLEEFHKKYPSINVVISNSPTPETVEALFDEHIDFGIVSTPLPTTHQNIVSKPLKEIKDIFVVGSEYVNLSKRITYFAELPKLPIICLEKSTSTRRFLDEYLAEKGITIHPEFELATSDMIIQFAKKNFGIGYVMEDFAREAIENGELFKLRMDGELPTRTLNLICKENNLLSPCAKIFLEMLDISL